MTIYKFLLAALLFFVLGTAVLYAGANRAPFRAAPSEHKHHSGTSLGRPGIQACPVSDVFKEVAL